MVSVGGLMVEIPIALVILIGIALLAVIYIETQEYRKYVKAAKALTAFGEGMKITFEQMAEGMNRMSSVQTALVLDSEEKDRQIQSILLVQSSHTEALSMKLLTEMAKDVQRESEDATGKI